MEQQIILPKGNPTKFTIMNYENIPQYVSKFMDDFLFNKTIEDFEEVVDYPQPWLKSDAVRNQFIANFGPVILNVYTCRGIFLFDQELEPVLADADRVGYNLYIMDYDPSPLAYGRYYFTLDLGGGALILCSEPFEILKSGKNTNLLEFDHPTPRADLIFYKSNGVKLFSPSLRTPGRLKYLDTDSIDTMYFDQVRNATMQKSVNYDTYTYILGRSTGVPPWKKKKVSRIFGMENVKCDGLLIAKVTENQKWEKLEQEEYPMQGWRIQVSEKLVHDSTVITTTAPVRGLNSVVAVIEQDGFGIEDQGGNFLEIIQSV